MREAQGSPLDYRDLCTTFLTGGAEEKDRRRTVWVAARQRVAWRIRLRGQLPRRSRSY